jgi:hypothetical protein
LQNPGISTPTAPAIGGGSIITQSKYDFELLALNNKFFKSSTSQLAGKNP